MTIVSPSQRDDTIRSLAGFVADRAPVVSCYVDVDGRRHPRFVEVEQKVDLLLRRARQRLNGDASAAVVDDLRRIGDYVRDGIDRSHTRGLAFFACGAHDLFEVVALPVPVRDRVVVNHVPAVGHLESVLQEHEPIGLLLADRQRARMFVFELGELTERAELFEELPRDYDTRGERERGTPDSHVEALAHAHLRHAAEVAFRAFQERPFGRMAVGAPDSIASELESELHPYLRDRLCGRAAIPVGAGLSEIRNEVLELEHRAERAREAELVARLREEAQSGRRGVTGLAAVLEALNERRVDVLLVSEGYVEDGWRCPESGALAVVGPASPVTGRPMDRVDDVVEEAVDLALANGTRAEVCVDNADLDCLGRIGALLRY